MKTLNLMASCAVFVIASLAHSKAQAGPLGTDLRGTAQNWDKVLPANNPGGPCPNSSTRFTCVMNNQAVRDNETGLVWSQPSTETRLWHSAGYYCNNLGTGGRKGWRLPSAHELASLVESNTPFTIALPDGHPFAYVASTNGYWTATAVADNGSPSGAAFTVVFQKSQWFEAGTVAMGNTNYQYLPMWCVRGGGALATYPQ